MTWDEEKDKIIRISSKLNIDPAFIATIRKVENGREERAFGVLSTTAPDYDSQLQICCNSVRNSILRYKYNPFDVLTKTRLVYSPDFIAFFVRRWAPQDASNDPTGLNKNWYGNAINIYRKFSLEGF